jgi:hypothetical protein
LAVVTTGQATLGNTNEGYHFASKTAAGSPAAMTVLGKTVIERGISANQWKSTDPQSSADLAPLPLGDGEVNILDLQAMAEYWLEHIIGSP